MSASPPPGAGRLSLTQAMQTAAQLHRAGRLAEAIGLYQRIIEAAPKAAEAHNNLAAAQRAAGQMGAALDSYRRAVALRPGYATAEANLGALLVKLGNAAEGLEHLAAAYLTDGAGPALRDRLVAHLGLALPDGPGPDLSAALERLAGDAAIDPQILARPGAAVLRAAPPVAEMLARSEASGDAPLAKVPDRLYEVLSAPLPMALLGDAVMADAGIETLLTALRRFWLARIGDGADAPAPLDLMAAVALQATATEWIWPESAAERATLAALTARLAGRGGEAALDAPVIAMALYGPLGSLPEPQSAALRDLCAGLAPGPARDLLTRHLVEPREEAALAADLPQLTEVADDVSRKVQAQYEANAYPRWRRLPPRPSRKLAEAMQGLFPDAPLSLPLAEAPSVLIAGCGTGRHALGTATRFTGADVLAVDLSRASLGFAARQARDLGIANIRFAQADILGLAALEDRFDLIECSGTLHHMADPEAGWQVLAGLLAPRGLMRISLYSARGRADVAAMRERIAAQGWPPTKEGIRMARAAWRSPEDGAPPPLTETPDFFSMSGCRDLLFHEQEIRFDLPRIARALDAMDLTFLGFELPSASIRQAFLQRHPEPGAERDLRAWDAFEAENPTIFAAMYQFWCQKGADA